MHVLYGQIYAILTDSYALARTNPLSLQTTVSIPLVRQASNTYDLYKSKESITLPADDRLDAFRDYITSARSGKVYIREEISKVGPTLQSPFLFQFIRITFSVLVYPGIIRERTPE